MEGLLVLAVVAVLAMPIAVIVLFVKVAGLKDRLTRVERQLAARALAAASTVASAAASTAGQDAASAVGVAKPAPQAISPAALTPTDAPAPPPRAVAEAAPAAAARSSEPAPAPRRAPAPPSGPDALERLAGWLQGHWVYVVSAASLALAGVFFVQYGMERGLLPPGLRVLAALGFGAALIAAGEYLRRRHGDEGAGTVAFLPSVFSGAGIVTLFAGVLAARQLYGLIGPGLAFAGHMGTAALAVAIGWFSGPLLVAIGLVGAVLAPFLVGGSSTEVDWLYGYFALVAALGLAVDAVRRWRWVSVLALVLSYGGALVLVMGGAGWAGWAVFLCAMVVLTIILPPLRLIPSHEGPNLLQAVLARGAVGWPGFAARLSFGAVLASSVGLFMLTDRTETSLMAFAALTLLVVALTLWAEKAEGLADQALIPAAVFLAATMLQGADGGPLYRAFAETAVGLRPPESAPSWAASLLLGAGLVMSLCFGYRALRPGPMALAFGLAAVLSAPLTAAALELLWAPATVLGPYAWALHLMVVAGLMTAFARRFAMADAALETRAMRRAAHATLSALSLIALALFVVTSATALTLALAVLIVVAAALDRRFGLPEMGLFLQAGAAVLAYRLLIDPGLGFAMDGPLWAVILAFVASGTAMAAALWLMRPLERPMAVAVAESALTGIAVVLANVLLTRWLTQIGGTTGIDSHWAMTLNAMPWLVMMLTQLYRARLGGPLTTLRRALGAVGGAVAGLGLGLAATAGNPLFSWGPEETGGLILGPYLLDSLALAYAVPGALLIFAARKMPGIAPVLAQIFVATGCALVTLYAGLEIRRLWQGDWLGAPGVLQGELYSYTIAMMVLGGGLLLRSIAKRSDMLRRAAMAVIALTVVKVFFWDAAGLTGLTRVASFAGLGLSLAGLAWLNRWAERAVDDPASPPPAAGGGKGEA